MDNLTYEQLLNENDIAIPQLQTIYQFPEVSRYIHALVIITFSMLQAPPMCIFTRYTIMAK